MVAPPKMMASSVAMHGDINRGQSLEAKNWRHCSGLPICLLGILIVRHGQEFVRCPRGESWSECQNQGLPFIAQAGEDTVISVSRALGLAELSKPCGQVNNLFQIFNHGFVSFVQIMPLLIQQIFFSTNLRVEQSMKLAPGVKGGNVANKLTPNVCVDRDQNQGKTKLIIYLPLFIIWVRLCGVLDAIID